MTASPSTKDIATLTVMRGELDRLPGMLASLGAFSERHLVETGESADWADDFPDVQVHHAPLPWGAAFDAARNVAVPHIRASWVLIVDTDELVPPTLVEHLIEQLPNWQRAGVEAVYIPRRNHVLGHPLRHSASWPDYQLRFMQARAVKFGATLHRFDPEVGKTVRLAADPRLALQHHSFPSTSSYVSKVNLYSDIEALQSPTGSSIARAVLAGARDFASRFVRARGFRDGAAGLHFAVCMAFYRYLAEAKRWEKSQK